MKKYRTATLPFIVVTFAFLTTLSAGCSGDSDDDTDAEVREIAVDDRALTIGEEYGVDLDFSFARDSVFDDGDRVSIALQLPAGVAFVEGSSRIDGFDDESVTPFVTGCSDGSSILFFDLDEDDLRGAEDPDGSADGRLELEIIGLALTDAVSIQARADYDGTFASCDVGVLPQAAVVVSVVDF